MGKQTAQGTKYETLIVKEALLRGLKAFRIAKRGIKGEPDVKVEPRDPDGPVEYLPTVFWQNWVKREKRRRSVRMVTLKEEDYWKLFDNQRDTRYGMWVQAKSTQTLSVRMVLEQLVEAITKGEYE